MWTDVCLVPVSGLQYTVARTWVVPPMTASFGSKVGIFTDHTSVALTSEH